MATKEKKSKKEEKKGEKTHPLIIGARITEKSAVLADKGVYTFNIVPGANKTEIKKAIKTLYNVVPTRVAITKITEKIILRRGVPGVKPGGKKAVVYLKKGDKIAFA